LSSIVMTIVPLFGLHHDVRWGLSQILPHRRAKQVDLRRNPGFP
jgi:hypothetical protein